MMTTPVSSDFPGKCNFIQGEGGRFSKTFTYSAGVIGHVIRFDYSWE